MKMLVDARVMGVNPSGIGMYIFGFLKKIIEEPDMKIYLLSDVSESEEIKYFINRKIPVLNFGYGVKKNIMVYKYFRYVQKKIHEIKPDIFWEPNNIIPRILKNPYGHIMLTIHDITPITANSYYGILYQYYFRRSLKIALKSTNLILYDSKDTKETVEHYYPASKAKKSLVAYVIVDGKFCISKRDDGYFLYIGNMEMRKGTDILLEAYGLYRAAGGQKKLYLAGRLREERIQKILKENMKKDEGIKYLGYINQQEKDKLLTECSCFIFPSRAEGFGMPPIEAMYYQKPIILSDLTVFKEIIGDCVEYFQFFDGKAAKNLSERMLDIGKNVNIQQYNNIIHKYDGETLEKNLMQFLMDKI